MGEVGPETMKRRFSSEEIALNAVCPYFTMFPLRFPLSVLSRVAESGDVVFDPFCGRGTTNYAARLLRLPSIALDSSRLATATTEAKLVSARVSPDHIVQEARRILGHKRKCDVPRGQFWSMAYKREVLTEICLLRKSLLDDCRSQTRKALRGIVLGALHGPFMKDGTTSYFSNQAPRTFAPKPRYAVAFWRRTGYRAPSVSVLDIITRRAVRYYSARLPTVDHVVRRGDSRHLSALRIVCGERKPRIIVTSPPYYGLRTYVPDQWLRDWFLGGPERVDYSYGVQLSHRSTTAFVKDLQTVWRNVATISHKRARLIFRFGAINDRLLDPADVIKASLEDTPWRLVTISNAGTAYGGRRQADSFDSYRSKPVTELDAWAIRQ